MEQIDLKRTGQFCLTNLGLRLAMLFLLSLNHWNLAAAEPVAATPTTPILTGTGTNAMSGYYVQAYVIQGKTLFSTNILVPLFSKYTGTHVSLEQIVRAASDLDLEYRQQGYTNMNIIIAPKRITNGIVTMNAFPGAVAQIVVAGNRYLISGDGSEMLPSAPGATPGLPQKKSVAATSTATNTGPRFAVDKYLIAGNTVLPPTTLATSLTNINGTFGTNVSLDGIRSAVAGLQGAYRERGYVTVSVGLPPQKLTNATVKIQVTEGRLAAIEVKGNRYFSSNNVMRALPSLHTNIILNGLIFQAELNRANANQDRQIYPVIEPGPDPGTSDLTLKVKDQLPLHGKVEYNNQSSPGTPDSRLNASAVYNNLWNLEHSLGIQYSFSPFDLKTGTQWNFYDLPLVANYSAFYRMPLGNPQALEDEVASNPGSFGYDEATRKFNLPPASGQTELNFYASRSTIDTGLETVSSSLIYNVPGVRTITQNDVQQDLTVNNDLGARISSPVGAAGDFRSDLSGGLDFKTYQMTSYKTNAFQFTEITVNAQGHPNPPVYSTVVSPVPVTHRPLEYLPLSLNYSASWHIPWSTLTWGLGISGNPWYSGSLKNLRNITGSTKSSGHWVTLNPSFSWQIPIHTNWLTTLRADGQWASEPLISNEQFGAGGVNSVRGYHEGEVFGDSGWHVTLEEQTPPHMVGIIFGKTPLVIRGSVYMDYAQTYLLDPQGRPDGVALWGAGLGGVASIGSHLETRLLFSLPLSKTTITDAYRPFFNFALTAQF